MQSYDFLFSTFLLDYVLLASRLSTHLISVCKLLFWNNFLNIVSNVLEKTHSAKIRLEDVLMESLKNVLKSLGSPSMVPYVTPRNESAVGRPKTYSIIIHKMGFYDFFFSFFLIPTVYQTFHFQNKSKTWYVLYCFYYCPGCFDQNRTIRRRPQDVVYWLESKFK